MARSVSIAPPNSLIVVAAAPTDPPSTTRDASIWANGSCILILCLIGEAGDTRIKLGLPLETDRPPAFDGYIDTPRLTIAVWIVAWEKILEMKVGTTRSRVRIWTNRHSEPDDVYIGVGE